MDFRDLIAWQQVQVKTYHLDATNTGPVLVAPQNPSRLYLSISQGDMDNPHVLYPGSPPPGQTCGIPIGGSTLFTQSAGGALTLTGTDDPATGAVDLAGTATAAVTNQAAVPSTWEFWVDRHGALCQFPWYFIADGCIVCVVVVEVIMDRDPCQFTSTGQMRPAKPRSLPRGRSLLSTFVRGRDRSPAVKGGRNVLDLYKRGERPPGSFPA